jgi:RimJ/RimL family protein N-acetyltransferase
MKIVVTPDIQLSELDAFDEAAVVEHLREREVYERTLRLPFPYTPAHFHEWLRIVEATTQQQGRPLHWAIRNEQNLLLGGCGFESIDVGKSHRAEIGYWLAKPYWGRGIMTSVVRSLCRHGFDELGLVKIVAHVFADNVASIRVLKKCGFVQEGYLHKHYLKDGRFHDARLFALLDAT